MTVAALAALAAFLYLKVSEEAAKYFLLGIGTAVIAIAIFLPDEVSDWLGERKNFSIWGLWLSLAALFVLSIPTVITMVSSIWAAVTGSFEPLRCVGIIGLIILVVLLRVFRPRR